MLFGDGGDVVGQHHCAAALRASRKRHNKCVHTKIQQTKETLMWASNVSMPRNNDPQRTRADSAPALEPPSPDTVLRALQNA